MKILVLCTAYPVGFIHTRNAFYKKNGIDVTVLDFSTHDNYLYDEISVVSLKTFSSTMSDESWDLVVSHAPNLRQHLLFLLRYLKSFKKVIFFFHGHEVLRIANDYPAGYPWNKTYKGKQLISKIYDPIKFLIWSKYLARIIKKAYFVFVSEWMEKKFFDNLTINRDLVQHHATVIYNSVSNVFEVNHYTPRDCLYDFITVRSNLDEPKYCIDLICNLAKNNPTKKFQLIGKGDFFKHTFQPNNIDVFPRTFTHSELIPHLNRAKCSLMPTRLDSQGVMMCEMATFGMPLITSALPVCQEVLNKFPNVSFLPTNSGNENLELFIPQKTNIYSSWSIPTTFYAENTLKKEVCFFQNIILS